MKERKEKKKEKKEENLTIQCGFLEFRARGGEGEGGGAQLSRWSEAKRTKRPGGPLEIAQSGRVSLVARGNARRGGERKRERERERERGQLGGVRFSGRYI